MKKIETKSCQSFLNHSQAMDQKQIMEYLRELKSNPNLEQLVNPFHLDDWKSRKRSLPDLVSYWYNQIKPRSFIISIGDSPSKIVHAMVMYDNNKKSFSKLLKDRTAYIPVSGLQEFTLELKKNWLSNINYFLSLQNKPTLEEIFRAFDFVYFFDTSVSGDALNVLSAFILDFHTRLSKEDPPLPPLAYPIFVSLTQGYVNDPLGKFTERKVPESASLFDPYLLSALGNDQLVSRCIRKHPVSDIVKGRKPPTICDLDQLQNCMKQTNLLDYFLADPKGFETLVRQVNEES